MSVLSQTQQQTVMGHIRESTHTVYELNSVGDDLVVWKWPVDGEGGRITPSDLRRHRLSHRFRGPRCLCAVASGGDSGYKESSIFMVTWGRHAGEYIASCATEECLYFVLLEQIYSKSTIPVKRYDMRRDREARPQEVLHLSEQHNGRRVTRVRPLKRSYALLNVNDALRLEPRAPVRSVTTPFEKLLQLDASTRPGLTEEDFVALFARCHCGVIVTRRAFLGHYCQSVKVDVIDLTTED